MLKSFIRGLLDRLGWELRRRRVAEQQALADLPKAEWAIVQRVAAFTMTSLERRASLLQAVDHVVRNHVPGAFVECGVWRGGSMMAVALALLQRGITDRDLYLFDTFEGMSEPGGEDFSHDGRSAESQLASTRKGEGVWCEASLDDVRANLASTGYPMERIHFVQGRVEDSIPGTCPPVIALLRLDTDWYESTRHELQNLYPRLQPQGILIVDDYGHWQGARQAVDEYFADHCPSPYLHRVDYTARLLVKAS